MIKFFKNPEDHIIAVSSDTELSEENITKLKWLFGDAHLIEDLEITGTYLGPRANMISPWSTNAVEMTQNMGIKGITRIESFELLTDQLMFDPMLMQKYNGLDQDIFTIDISPEDIKYIDDIADYNAKEGLALSNEEIQYLENLAQRLNRKLSDSEVFGFSQVNSEHCRHKIFNGSFIIDNEKKPKSLFQWIKRSSSENPNSIISAYKDNVAFIQGPKSIQFAPKTQNTADFYRKSTFESVLSLKAETHNFPTTVEPFNGAATGSGGEIRDRMAGGKGSLPLAGTALYMTAYPRHDKRREWVKNIPARKWLYQKPLDILIKASNGASDFGNKFGQPLINGSLLCFEHQEADEIVAYDKVIMLAGGVGYGKKEQALKAVPKKGDKIIIMGGDNYRIGMGGAAVSSADTGEFGAGIELNAVQRSNPEMQKRVSNAVRAMVESDINPIVSIHDHGAGGHLNCLSELVEETGGLIYLDQLPLGDPTLSAKEIIGNESQERMGLIVSEKDLPQLMQIAERERAPLYVVGEVTEDHSFIFYSKKNGKKTIDLQLNDLFGSSPKTIMSDKTIKKSYADLTYNSEDIQNYLENLLRIEAVACKDWLTNKVDRCVGGKVAIQQCTGSLQLPLNNCGVSAIDYDSFQGVATSMGHAPVPALIDPAEASRLAVLEALCNIIWAPLENDLKSVSLSANWMWPCNNPGEDARIYEAVESLSDFAVGLGINIPTGKDSLSMKQKYTDREVLAPGTVVISAAAHCSDIRKVVEPGFKPGGGSIYYIKLTTEPYALGGSSFAQIINKLGKEVPVARDPEYIRNCFDTVQHFIHNAMITSGHDVSAGGLITCLLESCFPNNGIAADLDLDGLMEHDIVKLLFAENNALVLQSVEDLSLHCKERGIECIKLGEVIEAESLQIKHNGERLNFNIDHLRDIWYESSFLFDSQQTAGNMAQLRYDNYKKQPLQFQFHASFNGELPSREGLDKRPVAAIIREKGSNSERELAHAMYLAGFDVKDIHMTDLITGRENLEDIQFLGAVGGFSNSDVLGSAKGWAGAFLFNEKAKTALDNFFARKDVLSVGICNGCQLFVELNLINPEHPEQSRMLHNDSYKHECAFTSVVIPDNNSVMLGSLSGSKLGVWISHGEGKFHLPLSEDKYNIVAKYAYEAYPANPNGSDYSTAMLCSHDGRHLAMMPHIERSIFKCNWAYYPDRNDTVSPWIEAFVNARKWCVAQNS